MPRDTLKGLGKRMRTFFEEYEGWEPTPQQLETMKNWATKAGKKAAELSEMEPREGWEHIGKSALGAAREHGGELLGSAREGAGRMFDPKRPGSLPRRAAGAAETMLDHFGRR